MTPLALLVEHYSHLDPIAQVYFWPKVACVVVEATLAVAFMGHLWKMAVLADEKAGR